MELFDGDVTFQGSFNKIGFTEDDQKVTAGFKPPKGEQFVVLLLGTVKKGAIDCNPEEMLKRLGFFRSPHIDGDQP